MGIILLGLGKVGAQINDLCIQSGLKVKATVSPNNPLATHKKISDVFLDHNDTVIDFSSPNVVSENTEFIAKKRANIVMGTTGWEDQKEKIQKIVKQAKIGFAYTPNYLPEVHLFWNEVRALASKLSQKYPNTFQAQLLEKRLQSKKFVSSTAKYTAQKIAAQKGLIFQPEQNFIAVFNGEKALDLTVKFQSKDQCFTLHFESCDSTKNNLIYAEMALKTAQWLQGKQGFFELTPALIEKIQALSIISN